MKSARRIGGILAVVLMIVTAADAVAPQTVRVIVPVVGSVTGVGGARWLTDVVLRNDFKTEATVSLTLPTAPDQPFIIVTIPPGEALRFGNVVGEAFGMDSALSPLVIETLGNRSITVSATTYAVRGTEVSPPQPIALQIGLPFTPMRLL